MNIRRLSIGFAVLVLLTGLVMAVVLSLTGTSFAQPKLKVGILHIGSIADAGYNQAHAEGVQVMKKNLPNVELIEVENVPEGADAERVMENMIRQGAQLVIPASFGMPKQRPDLRKAGATGTL